MLLSNKHRTLEHDTRAVSVFLFAHCCSLTFCFVCTKTQAISTKLCFVCVCVYHHKYVFKNRLPTTIYLNYIYFEALIYLFCCKTIFKLNAYACTRSDRAIYCCCCCCFYMVHGIRMATIQIW